MVHGRRYAEYLRKSRYDDPHKTVQEVLQKHRELLAEFQEKNGISVAPEDLYEEVVSGDSLCARPKMLRLLEAVERGDYRAVICMDIQRLGRGSMSDQGAILDAFKISGTQIMTPAKTYDLEDELDETYTEFETFLGRQELRMIKKRLQRGKEKTVQDGGYCANPPYGYERCYQNKKPTLKIVEEEAEFVKMIFDCYGNRGMGGQQTADRINALGAKPRRAECFGRTSIVRILKNPVYLGKVAWNRESHIRKGARGNDKKVVVPRPEEEWTFVEGLHPAIIGEELFDKVQERLAARCHAPEFTGIVENSLAGLMVCANCGSLLQRQCCKGGPLLLCTNRGCTVSSRLEYVEEAVLRRLRAEYPGLTVTLSSAAQAARDGSPAEREAALAEKELAGVRAQLLKAQELLEREIYDIPTFLARQSALRERIGRLEKARERLLFSSGRSQAARESLEQVRPVSELYAELTPQEQNRLLKCFIEQILYSKEKGALPKEFSLKIRFRALL